LQEVIQSISRCSNSGLQAGGGAVGETPKEHLKKREGKTAEEIARIIRVAL